MLELTQDNVTLAMKTRNEQLTRKYSIIVSWLSLSQNQLWVEIWQWSRRESRYRTVIVFLSTKPDRNNLVWPELSWPTQTVCAVPQQSAEWAGPFTCSRLSGSEMLQPCGHVDAGEELLRDPDGGTAPSTSRHGLTGSPQKHRDLGKCVGLKTFAVQSKKVLFFYYYS